MTSFKIKLNKDALERFESYLSSDIYSQDIGLTDHWERRKEANKNRFVIKGDNVIIDTSIDDGLSDNYKNHFFYNKSKIKYLINKNKTIKRNIVVLLLRMLNQNHGISYNPISRYVDEWNNVANAIPYTDIFNEYGYIEVYGIYKNAAIYNYIKRFEINNSFKPNNILEIGAGPGSLTRFTKKLNPTRKFTLIDLSFNLPFSFLNLAYNFPNSTFRLPNEMIKKFDESVDFNFVSSSQIDLLPNSFYDAGINTMSFQEMRTNDIEEYFLLLRRVLKKENIFFCLNAVEKPMIFDNKKLVPIRFHEYPWIKEDVNYEYTLSTIEQGRTYKPFYWKATKLYKSEK